MKINRRRLIIQSFSTVAALSAGAPRANAGKTLTVCIPSKPKYADCALNNSMLDKEIYRLHLFDTLFEKETEEHIPRLAESYSWDSQNKTLIIRLRSGIKFHRAHGFKSSRSMSAEDVIYSFRRHNDDSLTLNDKRVLPENFKKLFNSVEKIDDLTLRMQLIDGNLDATLTALSSFQSAIVSAEYAEFLSRKNNIDQSVTHPIGTGSFKLVYNGNHVVRLKRHSGNWKSKSNIEFIEFQTLSNAVDRFSLLRTSKCHVATCLPSQLLATLQRAKLQKTHRQKTENLLFISVGKQKPILQDDTFIKILYGAIDRHQLNRIHYSGMAEVKTSLLQGRQFQTDETELMSQSEARKHLEQYRPLPGSSIKLDLLISSNVGSAAIDHARIGHSIKRQLAEFGIEITIRSVESAEKIRLVDQGEVDLALVMHVPENGTPLATLEELSDLQVKNKVARFPQGVTDHIQQHNATEHLGERTELLNRINSATRLSSRVIPLLNIPWIDAVHPSVSGFKRGKSGNLNFRDTVIT